jgi:hypothetical protein
VNNSSQRDALKAILLSIVAMKCFEGFAEVKVGGVILLLTCLNWHETNRQVKKFALTAPRFGKLYWYNQIEALITSSRTWVIYMGFKCGRILCAIWETRYKYFIKLPYHYLSFAKDATSRAKIFCCIVLVVE